MVKEGGSAVESPSRNRVYRWFDRQIPLTDFLDRHVTKYMTPKNLSYWWNFGSLAGLFLVLQIFTGFFLAAQYQGTSSGAFGSVQRIVRDVEWGWLLQSLHSVGASFIFAVVYLHLIRGLLYGSYKEPRKLLWLLGLAMLVVLILAAFTGYLLPWGQMSYWAAQVITDLFSAIPFVGEAVVEWVRGGFVVGNATLTRMYAIHVMLVPVLLIFLVLLHLSSLHRVGSGNPTGVDIDKRGPDAIPFHPLYTAKDSWFMLLVTIIYFGFVFFAPDFFQNPDNYIEANPLKTPPEIVPEWYLLPFYAILRSVPNKTVGIIALISSLGAFFVLPWIDTLKVRRALRRPIFRWFLLVFLFDLLVLGYFGSKPPLGVNLIGAQIATVYYFLFFALIPVINRFERQMIEEDER